MKRVAPAGVTTVARRGPPMGLRACARVLRTATLPWRCLSPSVATSPPGSARAAHVVRALSAGALAPFARSPPAGYRQGRGVPGSRVPPHARTASVARAASSSSASSDGLRGSLSARAADAIVSSWRDDDERRDEIPSSRDVETETETDAPPTDGAPVVDARYPWYARSFWTEQVTGPAVKQSARLMAKRLDFDDPLGVDLTLRGASSSAKRDGVSKSTPKSTSKRRLTLYDYALEVKQTHPKKVLLIRVGEFYEALGFDAVLLVMHAGLNPMGTTGVPRAGCPLVKVQETLDRLTNKGFAVVVCEEVPSMNPYGQRAPPKERYVAAVCTPASPQYVVGAADAGDDVAFDGDAPPPVVAAAATANGYTLISVEPDLRRATVLEGLTAESAAAKLAASGHAPPLYRHASLDGGFGARGGAAAGVSGPTRRLRMEIGNILSAARDARGDGGELGGGYAAHQRYDAKDPAKGILEIVRREYNMPPDAAFEIVKAGGGPGSNVASAGANAEPSSRRPYPLSLATAQQLGVLPTRSVPPLLSHVLPASAGAPAACRAYMQELLLHPPPLDTARAISNACAALTSLTPADGAVPRLEVTPPAKIAKLLRTREGSHVFFAELSAMARAVRLTLEHDSSKTRFAGESLLNPTSLKVGRPVDRESLVAACASAEAIVAGVVAAEVLESPFADASRIITDESRSGEDPESMYREKSDVFLSSDEYAEESSDDESSDDADDFAADAPPRLKHLPSRFLRLNEPWRGRVRREVVADAVEEVESAARELSKAIDQDLAPVLRRTEEAATGSRKKRAACFLEHDQRNNALWLRHLSASEARSLIDDGVPLLHPVDRWGKEISDRWSTERVERAADAYRVAAVRAGGAVSSALRALAEALDDHVSDLIAAATFSAIATAVSLHAKHALKRGWHSSTLLDEDDVTTPWTMKRLTPFWMPRDGSAVPNDVTVSGVIVLTGPNMAGKSTVLRATACAALLSNCGLFVPAETAVVPHFDNLVARMSSTDSPAEGLSSYAVEMAEVSTMLDVVTPKSLVFIDELGRGTEAAHGTAMGGAVIEALDAAGARGMFATHLHGVLDLPLRVSPFVTRAKMETVETVETEDDAEHTRRLAPTWRVVPGECRESLALQTATDMGVRADVVARGKALLGDVLANERSRYGGGISALDGIDDESRLSLTSRPEGNEAEFSATSASNEKRAKKKTRALSIASLRSALAEEFESLLAASETEREETQGSIDLGFSKPRNSTNAKDLKERVGYVGFDETPSAASGAWTCVYVLRRADGWAYCGETDDLAKRLETHRATARRESSARSDSKNRNKSTKIECVFVTVPKTSGGKSAARLLESRVIRRLANEDAPLLSGRDARNVSFGSGGAE